MTQAGVVLGTAAYMAPEQAKGKPLDRRADVWAFGAVLYEMLTGQRAFRGEDTTDTIVSVLSKEPDWSAVPANTPASMRKLLRRCLEKDRKRRLDSAADARLEIEDALAAPSSFDGAATSAAPGRRRAVPAAFTIVAVLLVATSVPAVRHLIESPPPAPPETRARKARSFPSGRPTAARWGSLPRASSSGSISTAARHAPSPPHPPVAGGRGMRTTSSCLHQAT